MSVLRPGLCKALTKDIWQSLRQAHIMTVTDFVVLNTEDIAKTCGILYKDVLSIRRVLLAQFSTFPLLGDQQYMSTMSSHVILSTGLAGLDDLLDGGLYAGELCELAGETASGKTQVCVQCAVTVAGVYQHGVVYVDTGGSFSSQAALRLMPPVGDQQIAESLSRIRCVNAHDVYALLSALDDLRYSLKSQTLGQDRGVKLVVVDCVAAVFSSLLGGQQMDSLALMEQLGRQLKSIAMDFNIAVLVTNTMSSGLEGGRKPSLGKLWAHVPHTRILVHREDTSRTISLVKSCRTKTFGTAQINFSTT